MTQQGMAYAGAARRSAHAARAALARSPLVDGLSSEDAEAVAAEASVYWFEPGQVVFEEGDPCRGLWILATGRVRLHHDIADGRSQVVGFRAPAAALELGSAFDGRPHLATAVALDDSALLFLSRPRLADMIRRHPQILSNVIAGLCLEIRQRDILTANAALKDARGRIGCALLQLARQFGVNAESGAVQIDYRLTRQDIADRAGVTIETAIRALSELQRRGIVQTDSQVIAIRDVARLRLATGCGDCQFDCSVFASPNGKHPAAART
jgi:CRP/FNR family cyclic AMP-dependent transcriptional regulator